MNHSSKLNGWKMIARHFERSERTIQSWEADRGLPVHRIPGVKGWTVYAYAHELDAWMKNGNAGAGAEISPSAVAPLPLPAVTSYGASKPGILVLPFAWRCPAPAGWVVDGYTEDLIARFASLHPALRVLSSTTSKHHRDRATSTEVLSRDLGVRYLVEGSIETTTACNRIDIRIVDAELDQVLLTNRFVSSRVDDASFRSLVVHGVVEHFSLVLAGALVEPLYPDEIDPESYVHYLEGVRYFTDGTSQALRNGCMALDRALVADAAFVPAQAMRALAHLQIAAMGELASADALDCALKAARTASAICKVNPFARVTAAFLDAAIAIAFDADEERTTRQLTTSLLAVPPSVPLRGRLYERRSHRSIRDNVVVQGHDSNCTRSAERWNAALEELIGTQPRNLFADVMHALARTHRFRSIASTRVESATSLAIGPRTAASLKSVV